MRGKFISIEGGEGAGKTSAINFIQKFLLEFNIELVVTREPGGTPLAESIRQLLLTPNENEKIHQETELLLLFAARAQHLAEVIKPVLNQGKWILSDRFIDATYAYQGSGRGVNLEWLATLDQLVVADCYPDLTILLDVPVELGFERVKQRGQPKDRIEQEKLDFFMRVRAGYLLRQQQYPERIKLIDASLSAEKVLMQIRQVLTDYFLEHQI